MQASRQTMRMLLKCLLLFCLIGCIEPIRVKRQENGDFWWLKKTDPQDNKQDGVNGKNKGIDDKQVEKEAEIEVAEKNGQGTHYLIQLQLNESH